MSFAYLSLSHQKETIFLHVKLHVWEAVCDRTMIALVKIRSSGLSHGSGMRTFRYARLVPWFQLLQYLPELQFCVGKNNG